MGNINPNRPPGAGSPAQGVQSSPTEPQTPEKVSIEPKRLDSFSSPANLSQQINSLSVAPPAPGTAIIAYNGLGGIIQKALSDNDYARISRIFAQLRHVEPACAFLKEPLPHTNNVPAYKGMVENLLHAGKSNPLALAEFAHWGDSLLITVSSREISDHQAFSSLCTFLSSHAAPLLAQLALKDDASLLRTLVTRPPFGDMLLTSLSADVLEKYFNSEHGSRTFKALLQNLNKETLLHLCQILSKDTLLNLFNGDQIGVYNAFKRQPGLASSIEILLKQKDVKAFWMNIPRLES